MRNVFASSGGGNHSSGKTIQEKGTKCLFNEERGEVEEQEEEGCIIRMQLGKRETFANLCHELTQYYTKNFDPRKFLCISTAHLGYFRKIPHPPSERLSFLLLFPSFLPHSTRESAVASMSHSSSRSPLLMVIFRVTSQSLSLL